MFDCHCISKSLRCLFFFACQDEAKSLSQVRHKLCGPKTDGTGLADPRSRAFSKLCETSSNENCPREMWEMSFLHFVGFFANKSSCHGLILQNFLNSTSHKYSPTWTLWHSQSSLSFEFSLFHNQKVAHLDFLFWCSQSSLSLSLNYTFTFPQHHTFVFPQPPTKNRPPGLSDAPKVHRGEVHSTCFSPSSPPPELKRKYWRKTFGLTFETGCDSCGTGIPFCQLSMPSTLCQKPLGKNIDMSRSKNSTKQFALLSMNDGAHQYAYL